MSNSSITDKPSGGYERPRMLRERKTVGAMIKIYCRGIHKTRELCAECRALLDYAGRRLDRCPFQEGKTTCTNCSVHCYRPSMREKIRSVMQYAGPRMLYHHPVLAAFHFADGFKKRALGRSIKP